MMLARDGHDVTVLERDAEQPRESLPEAFESWECPGVNPESQMTNAFITSSQYDPDCFRAFLEVMGCVTTPLEILSRPGMYPSRAELLELLS